MECCICYEKTGIYVTKCKHHICLDCILKLRKEECPYCRGQLNNLPDKIKDIISSNKDCNQPILMGGGGLGPYWDAPGSNYFELSDNVKNLLDKLKSIDYQTWSQIRRDINDFNHGSTYNEVFLQDLINSKLNSGFYTG